MQARRRRAAKTIPLVTTGTGGVDRVELELLHAAPIGGSPESSAKLQFPGGGQDGKQPRKGAIAMNIQLKDNILHLGSIQIDLRHRLILSLLCWALFPDPALHRPHVRRGGR